MISKKLQRITLLLVAIFGLLPGISRAASLTDADVWPEAYAAGVLIISGDDGEPIDRTTPCANAGQRYPVVGNFEFDLKGFTESGNILTYTLETAVPRRMAVIGAIVAKDLTTGSLIHYSVYHNGTEVFPRSISGTFLKVSDQAQAIPGFSFFLDVEENDTIEMRTWNGTAGADNITTHMNYIIYPIGRQYR